MTTTTKTNDGTKTVKAYRIGKDLVSFDAWEPYDGHGTQSTIDGQSMGRVGTRRLPAELDAMPTRTPEERDRRISDVSQWHENQYDEAVAPINECHISTYDPKEEDELFKTRHSMGTITQVRPGWTG